MPTERDPAESRIEAVVTGSLTALDPLAALERRLQKAVEDYEASHGAAWPEVEDLLTEGYGRLLAIEAMCTRLGRQVGCTEARPGQNGADPSVSRRELEEFYGALTADAARLRQGLGRFKARGLAARRRFASAS
jgi:hypothetical protein